MTEHDHHNDVTVSQKQQTNSEEQQTSKPQFKQQLQQSWNKLKQMSKKAAKGISAFFASRKKIDYVHYLYILIIAVGFINICIMTLHLWDREYNFPILPRSYISAISPDQDITDTMFTDIVTIVEFDPEDIQIGDNVLYYGDYGINEYWVQEVTNINQTANEISITYDGVSAIAVPFDDIVGTYVKDSNLFGTMYYTAKYPRGYTLMMTIHLIVVAAIYFESFDRLKGTDKDNEKNNR